MSLKMDAIINSAQSFETIRKIVEKASPEISWLGSRYISAEGYRGTISISGLIFRILEMVKKNPHFNETERAQGKEIAKRINHICKQSFMQQVNCLTKLLLIIRSIFNTTFVYGYSPILAWEDDGDNELFDYYTAKQYQSVFGVMPPEGWADWSQTGYPPRWRHPEVRAEYLKSIEPRFATSEEEDAMEEYLIKNKFIPPSVPIGKVVGEKP